MSIKLDFIIRLLCISTKLLASNEISPSTCSNHACTYVSDGRQLQPQNLSPKDESLPVFRTAPKENIEGLFPNFGFKNKLCPQYWQKFKLM